MRRAGLFPIVFLVLMGAAVASMVRFTGPRAARPQPQPEPLVQDAPRSGVLPVAGVRSSQLADTWGQSRDGGARPHQGIDIMAPRGTPVRAFADGRVEKLFQSSAGGTTIYQRSKDGRWSFYYAHLAGYVPDLREGEPLSAGQPIAFVGDTGNAGAGNTHLHFEVHRLNPGERWYQGTAVNPYPLLVGRQAAR
jgi:murein DD-endopeptidase MepM/ murein hydrolase activator NlpD